VRGEKVWQRRLQASAKSDQGETATGHLERGYLKIAGYGGHLLCSRGSDNDKDQKVKKRALDGALLSGGAPHHRKQLTETGKRGDIPKGPNNTEEKEKRKKGILYAEEEFTLFCSLASPNALPKGDLGDWQNEGNSQFYQE